MGKVTVILTRHGRYEQENGHITEKGKEEIQAKTIERIENYIGNENLGNTEFLIIASPTYWMDRPDAGQRAVETGSIIKNTISRQMNNQGINPEVSFYMGDRIQIRDKEIMLSDIAQNISEPNIWSKAPNWIKEQTERFGRNGAFWQAMAVSSENIKYERNGKEIHIKGPKGENQEAETGAESGAILKRVVKQLLRWGNSYSRDQDKDVCIFVVTHGEKIFPFTIGTKFEPTNGVGHNEGIVFVTNGEGLKVSADYSCVDNKFRRKTLGRGLEI